MNIQDIAITSLETITAFDPVTGAFKFALDELQDASISQSQETTEITGKGGRKISTLKRNKTVTISATNGLVSAGLMEAQTGGKFSSKATEIMWTDYLTVSGNAATTAWKAIGTAGSEIESITVRNADGTVGAELTQASATSAGKFAYAPSTKALTFTGITDGTEIVVRYKRKIQADVMGNKSDVYSDKATLYIDALGEDKCANVYRIQICVPKADISGEFSLDISDSQTVHAFEAEALAGACGAGGNLWTYTIFGANQADVA